MKEIWKDIPGFEGLYQASNFGRVKSLERVVRRKDAHGGYTCFRYKEKILSACKNSSGYMVVPLGKRHKTVSVHRLVALTFIPNPFCKEQVNHINGDRSDNKVENLEWCTNRENQRHAVDILKTHENLPQCRPVRCVETGEVFRSAISAARGDRSKGCRISSVCNGAYGYKTCDGYHWELV